jgi:hypothetical protein
MTDTTPSTPEPEVTALTVLPPESATQALAIPAEVSRDFEEARKLARFSERSFQQSISYKLLQGHEIARLYKKYGVKRGGDRKSASSPTKLGLIPWEAVLKAELGMSDEWAKTLMLAAKATEKKLPPEIVQKVLSLPLSDWQKEDMEQLDAGVKAICGEAQSFRQFAIELGVIKDKKATGESNNPAGRPEGSTDDRTLDQKAEDAIWPWMELFCDFMFGSDHLPFLRALPLVRDEEKSLKANLKDLEKDLANALAIVKEAIREQQGTKKKGKKSKNPSLKERKAIALADRQRLAAEAGKEAAA